MDARPPLTSRFNHMVGETPGTSPGSVAAGTEQQMEICYAARLWVWARVLLKEVVAGVTF